MDIKIPVEFPAIDLSAALPLLALVVLAALILVALTARALIKSRAFTIALITAVVILGSSTIVGSLQSIALLLGVAGVIMIGLVLVLGRNPDVLDLLHVVARNTAVSRSESTAPLLPIVEHDRQIGSPRSAQQLPAPQSNVRPAQRVIRLPKGWGF